MHKDHFQAAILQIVIIALGITGVLGTAFQCHPPRTWDYMHGECINLVRTSFNKVLRPCLTIIPHAARLELLRLRSEHRHRRHDRLPSPSTHLRHPSNMEEEAYVRQYLPV